MIPKTIYISLFIFTFFVHTSCSKNANKQILIAQKFIEAISSEPIDFNIIRSHYLSNDFRISNSILQSQILPSLKKEIKNCKEVQYITYTKLISKEKNIQLENGIKEKDIVVVKCNNNVVCFILLDKKDKIKSFMTINKSRKRFFVY